MQNLTFTHFGAGFGQDGVASSAAADFTAASKGGKIALSQGIMQSKTVNSAAWAAVQTAQSASVAQREIHGAKGVEFTAAQGKATNSVARAVQSVAKMGTRVINSTRVSSLSLSLSRSVFGAF